MFTCEFRVYFAAYCTLSTLNAIPTQVLVVADLTDPMLAPAEANGVFQVMLEQFRKKELPCGKLAVFDEAHKYLEGGDGLAHSIVDTVRLMRHEGIRVVVSTQSPLTMPPELLELSTVAVLHSFHSNDWFRYGRCRVVRGCLCEARRGGVDVCTQ